MYMKLYELIELKFISEQYSFDVDLKHFNWMVLFYVLN